MVNMISLYNYEISRNISLSNMSLRHQPSEKFLWPRKKVSDLLSRTQPKHGNTALEPGVRLERDKFANVV